MLYIDLGLCKFHNIVADIVEQSNGVGTQAGLLVTPHLILRKEREGERKGRREEGGKGGRGGERREGRKRERRRGKEEKREREGERREVSREEGGRGREKSESG